MKNTKKCPKCGSSEIIKIPGKAGAYGSGNNIPIGATTFSAVPVDRYLCNECGFSEEWVDLDYMKKVKKKYGDE